MAVLSEFQRLCRLAGSRLDWIQAGGGNASIKRGDTRMTIKASGAALAMVSDTHGVVDVNYPQIVRFLRDADRPRDWVLPQLSEGRPSIETYMHAALGAVVLHIHPWVALPLLCSPNWQANITEIMGPGHVYVPYSTPGVDLGIAVANSTRSLSGTVVIWLQSHGLIVSGPTESEVLQCTDDVTATVATALGIDCAPDRRVTQLQLKIEATTGDLPVVYRCKTPLFLEQDLVARASNVGPLFPDQAVFCGPEWPLASDLASYCARYGTYPPLIRHGSDVYVAAKSIQRAREIEDVATAQLTAVKWGVSLDPLSSEEIRFLQNWDAEKWRMQ
ncbi:class II aldolase [bacterium]|nr:class II aldolase [bacterium]